MRDGARPLGKWLATFGVAFAALAACGDPDRSAPCFPGDFIALTGTDGGKAFLRCGSNGAGYVSYVGPDPDTAPDADAPDAAACGANGEPLGYFCYGCSAANPCAAGLDCVDFTNKGGFLCTPLCQADPTLCVAPSEGCGNNGHCKP